VSEVAEEVRSECLASATRLAVETFQKITRLPLFLCFWVFCMSRREIARISPICPLRLLAVAVYKSGEAECIGKECAWYLICHNFSNLAEILVEILDKETT